MHTHGLASPVGFGELLLFTLLCGACASSAVRETAAPACPAGSSASTAFARNQRDSALKAFEGRVPLVRLRERAATREAFVPTYEVSVFDDGTVIYEGDRCVKVGGTVVTRLAPDDLRKLQGFLGEACVEADASDGDELCQERERIIHVTCSDGVRVHARSNRCASAIDDSRSLDGFAAEILERVAGPGWLGRPSERLACEPGAKSLSGAGWAAAWGRRSSDH